MNIELYDPVFVLDSANPGPAAAGNTLLERACNLERQRLAAQTWQDVLNLHTPDSARLIDKMGTKDVWLRYKANPYHWSNASSAIVSIGDPFNCVFLKQELPWAASKADFEASQYFFTTGFRCNGPSLLFDATLEAQDLAAIIGSTPPSGLVAALHAGSGGGGNSPAFTLTCKDEDPFLGTRQVSAGGTLHLVLGDKPSRARLSTTLANPANWGQDPVWDGVLDGLVDTGKQTGQASVLWSTAGGDKECGSYEVSAAEGTDFRSVTIETHIPAATDVPVTFDSLFPDFAAGCVSGLNAWHLTNIALTGRDTTINAHSENAPVYDSPDVKRSGFVTGVVPLGVEASYNCPSSALNFAYGVRSQRVVLTGSTQSTVKLSVESIGLDWSNSRSNSNDGWVGSVSTQGALECSLSVANPIQIGTRGIARAKLLSDAKVSIGFTAVLDPNKPKTVLFTLYVRGVQFPTAIYDHSRQFTYDDDPLDNPLDQLGFTGAVTSFSATIPDEKWQQLFGK